MEVMQRENEHLTSVLTDKEDDNAALRTNLEAARERIETGLGQFQSLAADKRLLKEELEALETQLEGKQLESAHLAEKLTKFEEERDLFLQLKQRFDALQDDREAVVDECGRLNQLQSQQRERAEELMHQIQTQKSQMQSLAEKNMLLEESQLRFEQQKELFSEDYALTKQHLAEAEKELQVSRAERQDDAQHMISLNEQMAQLRERIASFENVPHHQVQSKLKETIASLTSDLVAAQSRIEMDRLNFETEEEARKKKIERMDKELESVKQQVGLLFIIFSH